MSTTSFARTVARSSRTFGSVDVLIAGLLLGAAVPASAATPGSPAADRVRPLPTFFVAPHVLFKNAQTGKCLTIAGGSSQANNIHAVQYNCDADFSRQWLMTSADGLSSYQLQNQRTGQCLTVAGGRSTDNNVVAVQYD